MKYIFFLLIVFSLTIISCDKVDNNEKRDEFLLMDNLPLNDLTGSWDWENSNGWGPLLTPETEGYEKTITFENDRIYREYIDSELSFETYFRIDTAVSNMNDYELYTIYYLNDKAEQTFVFDSINGKSSLVIYDTDCRDCIGTHVYSKK